MSGRVEGKVAFITGAARGQGRSHAIRLAQLRRVDIVSANAGIFIFGDQGHDVSETDWDDVVDINLKGVWHTCKAVIPHLIEQGSGGSIVLTSSTAGLKGTPNVLPYTASKHAVVGIMRTLALELAPHSIRVNTIHPTGVATDMILNAAAFSLFLPDEAHPTRAQAAEVFQETNALPVPWVEPIGISNALLFLASDESRYVTGLELKVDAGYTIR